MVENTLSDLESELSLAGTDTNFREFAKVLEERRITRDKEIPPIEFLFSLSDVPCFPRGELVAITGKHKCGKTFVCSMLMSLAIREECLDFKRLVDGPLKVLWIDTEQSDTTTQDILRDRLVGMIGADGFPDSQFDIFNLRMDNWQVRMPLVECAMKLSHPDLVIFDGVRDVVGNINDYEAAQNTVEQLLHLVSEYKCCMVCVLHENKSLEDHTIRGAIGTELQNKCFEQYCSEKLDDKSFVFKQTHTRKYDIEDALKFKIDENGLPISLYASSTNPIVVKRSNPYKTEDGDYDIKRLFTDAFGDKPQLRASELRDIVFSLCDFVSLSAYDYLRKEALKSGVIVRTELSKKNVFYSLGKIGLNN